MEIEYFVVNVLLSLCTGYSVTQFFKNLAISIYIPKYIISKKLICSIAVQHLCLKTFKKITAREFNISIKVSSVGPATVLKKSTLSFLIFQALCYDYKKTIMEKTFLQLLSERFVPEKGFDSNSQVKCQLPHFL